MAQKYTDYIGALESLVIENEISPAIVIGGHYAKSSSSTVEKPLRKLFKKQKTGKEEPFTIDHALI